MAFWRARSFLLFPFLDRDLVLEGLVGANACCSPASSAPSYPLFLLFIMDSPSENPGARGRVEVSEVWGASDPSTDPKLIERLCIGISSLVFGVGSNTEGNWMTGNPTSEV